MPCRVVIFLESALSIFRGEIEPVCQCTRWGPLWSAAINQREGIVFKVVVAEKSQGAVQVNGLGKMLMLLVNEEIIHKIRKSDGWACTYDLLELNDDLNFVEFLLNPSID